MIIVAGHIRVEPTDRDNYLESCREVVTLARAAAGCLDFALSPDLVDAGRINIFERWQSADTLHDFRGEGSGEDLGAMILGADVREFDYESERKL
ncbi:putative quinol monooxygenase [Antrihabitans sp. YC2-6]|uniref:putative quinol monooxygenase n=1 Tax=Antrihabitans sp. YC2-6 TaxID=2799498 RepID=UPI0018F3F623|nr:antibiotic biosynthesis monooxygenase [Antrihabitans sp. YC2-6]MBJ8348059.1 antibiotic biosynthesis monooxygenase [Antrihabitans sp. YC2-6]